MRGRFVVATSAIDIADEFNAALDDSAAVPTLSVDIAPTDPG
ncbi:SOS response-associated peptidase [Phytoactinopolyspora endophytica]|nr:SOS response-associated peptidase [Phytoactinopolyspora endophytica]